MADPGQTQSELVEDLRRQLLAATHAACDAYRDSARLVRVLTVIGLPSSPERLMDNALDTLSTVFNADIVAIARVVRNQLIITRACGLAEGDESFARGWPVSRTAAEVLAGSGAVAHDEAALASGDDVPALLRSIGIRSAAWIPLWTSGGSCTQLLMLYRRQADVFTLPELRLLESVAFRLSLAVEARERSEAAERLAEYGPRLARHLELSPLLVEAATLFAALTGAVSTWIIDPASRPDPARGTARCPAPGLLASHGTPPALPAAVADLPGWTDLVREVPYADTIEFDGAVRSVLAVCVLGPDSGSRETLLYAFRDSPQPFLDLTVESAQIFANYLRSAMVNAELYHALRESESSLRLITDSVSDLIAVVDSAGRFVYVSPSHHRELGYEPADLAMTSVFDLAHADEVAALRAAVERPREVGRVEYRLRTGRGVWVWVESALHPAPSVDGRIVVSSRIIDDRKRLEHELLTRATHDPLTGLANRALTGQRLDEALASDAPSLVGLLFCDLDKFKAVNDRLGHAAGDELLKGVAERLRRCLRSRDLLARFGGDEFVFLLDGVRDLDDVVQIGKRVTEVLTAPFLLRGEWCQVSASVGGVCGVRGHTTASELLRDADAAMYSAKDKGDGLVEVVEDPTSPRRVDRLDLRSDLAHALDRNELMVHYQPIFDLARGRIIAFEALLRWRHPERGLIPPDTFVPLAEETDAIIPIGDWVLERACQTLAEWQDLVDIHPISIGINLSPTQLFVPGLAERILSVIETSGLAPSDVWLEVTEHRAAGTDVTALATALRQAGVHFALDDFGSAYSNLGHLTRFPAECLKIDKSLVCGVLESKRDRDIVRAILALANALGLTVIAEGVETVQQRRELIRLGCQLGQGYLLSPAVCAAEATALLASGRRLASALPAVPRQPAGAAGLRGAAPGEPAVRWIPGRASGRRPARRRPR